MLTFPGIGDRIVVLMAGLLMVVGLAFIVNIMRIRQEKAQKPDVK